MKQKHSSVHFENLDSLRALAAFSVIFYHIFKWIRFPADPSWNIFRQVLTFNNLGGEMGVQFFFVLSGFLITYLMFAEKEKTGRFNIPHFYFRRLLRIWPLYFVTLVIGFVAFPLMLHLLGHDYSESSRWWMYASFLTNFDHIAGHPPGNGILGVQWSVAIEEQFYLAWPLIFGICGRKQFPVAVAFLIVASSAFFIFSETFALRYYHTFSVMRYLGTGAFTAFLCFRYEDRIRQFLNRIPLIAGFFIILSGLFILFFQHKISLAFPLMVYPLSMFGMFFFAWVITEQNFSGRSVYKLGKIGFLGKLGRISYGLYLLHMVAIFTVLYLFRWSLSYTWLQGILVIVFTISFSALSYRILESPFLKLKGRFSKLP